MALFRRKPQGVPVDFTFGDPRAQRLVAALRANDLDAFRGALEAAGSAHELERLTMVLAGSPGHPELLDAWADDEPDRALAWLARGVHGVSEAWEIRGAGRSPTVDADAWERFFERLREAEDDLLRAADMDPGDPVAWTHLLKSGRGLQIPKEELWARFEEGRRRSPWLLEAHLQLLQGICAKWSGSDEDTLAFARETTRDAPAGAPVHAVVPMAHIEVWLGKDSTRESEEYSASAEARDEIQAAAHRSVLADGFEDDMVSMFALNVFATGMYIFGDEPGAAALAQRIGTRRSPLPWDYFDDAGVLYAELLAR